MTYQEKQQALFQSIEEGFKQGSAPSTIVEMKSEFALGEERCLTNVRFVPELSLNESYQELLFKLKEVDAEQYLIPTNALHTTVKNIRVVNDPARFTKEEIDRVIPAFQRVVSRIRPISIRWEGLLSLPTSLAIKGFSSERYTELVHALDGALQDAGVPDDKRYASKDIFASSITICRYRHHPSETFLNTMKTYKNVSFGETYLDGFQLVSGNSVLADSSVTVLATFKLGQ